MKWQLTSVPYVSRMEISIIDLLAAGTILSPFLISFIHSDSVKDSCRLPGCHNPRYVEKSGLRHDFCGRTHAELYKRKHGFTPTPLSHTGVV